MKRKTLLALVLLVVLSLTPGAATARFSIKIPKLKVEKPKQEQPKSDDILSPQSQPIQNQPTTQAGAEVSYMPRPEPDAVTPRFMINTLEIIARTEPRY